MKDLGGKIEIYEKEINNLKVVFKGLEFCKIWL